MYEKDNFKCNPWQPQCSGKHGLQKLPGISNFLRDVLRRTVASEFKVYCGDSSESILKATSPNDIASFSNGIFLHEVELWCRFWMSYLQGACCNHAGKLPKTKLKRKYYNKLQPLIYLHIQVATFTLMHLHQIHISRVHQELSNLIVIVVNCQSGVEEQSHQNR